MNTAATQSAKICRALLRGKSITPLSALRDFGCFRLGARIFDLRRAVLILALMAIAVACINSDDHDDFCS